MTTIVLRDKNRFSVRIVHMHKSTFEGIITRCVYLPKFLKDREREKISFQGCFKLCRERNRKIPKTLLRKGQRISISH